MPPEKFKTPDEASTWVRENLVETGDGTFSIRESIDLANRLRDLQAHVDDIPRLQSQLDQLAAGERRRRIFDEVKRAAMRIKVPLSVVDRDFERLVVPDFDEDETGRIAAKDGRTIEEYLRERQKERPHWQPVSTGSGAAPGRPDTSISASIAALFE